MCGRFCSTVSTSPPPRRRRKMELSFLWTVLGCLAMVRGLLPVEFAEALNRALRMLSSYLVPYVVFEIPEFEGSSINELYKNVQLHLTARDLCRSARKTVLCRVKNSNNTTSTLAGCESIPPTPFVIPPPV
jgi:hypothetical protein